MKHTRKALPIASSSWLVPQSQLLNVDMVDEKGGSYSYKLFGRVTRSASEELQRVMTEGRLHSDAIR
jgi:hypothetical protein